MFSAVCFGGSRSLPRACGSFVQAVVGRVVVAAPRASFSVGCAAGGDAFALSALVRCGAAARVSVFCVGDASGAGFWSGSALSGVLSAVEAGASPVWLAGGPLSVPLRERLAARSRAALVPGGVPVSVACWFLGSPVSRGSLAAARAAALAGVSVVVFPCGWESSLLAPLVPGLGSWAPVLAGPFVGGFVWVPAGAEPGSAWPPPWASVGGAARGGLSRRQLAALAPRPQCGGGVGAPSARPASWFVGALGPLGFEG